jgi:hypothetical protein
LLWPSGFYVVIFPEKIQRLYIKLYTEWLVWIPNPFLNWMKGPGYLLMLRIVAGLLIVMALASEIGIFISRK